MALPGRTALCVRLCCLCCLCCLGVAVQLAGAGQHAASGGSLLGADSLFVPAAQSRRLAVSVREGTAAVSGMAPGGRALVYQRSIETIHLTSSRVDRRLEIVRDEDGDGNIAVDLESTATTLDLLLVVDLAARDAVLVHTGERATVPRSVESLAVWRAADPRASDHLIDRTRWLDAVLVQGSGNVLAGDASDGGLTDQGGTVDGQVELALDDLESVEFGSETASDNAPPVRLDEGDLLLLVDPRDLAASLLVVRRRW